jgi:hypothetical protein
MAALAAEIGDLHREPIRTRMRRPFHKLMKISYSGGNMKARTTRLAVAVCLLWGTVAFAENPCVGTWKLNESKSKVTAGAPKNTSVTCETSGDSIKITVDGVDGQGKPAHNEWTGKFDGKDYPLTGDASADSRSYTQVDDHTQEFANKKEGKVTITGKIKYSADGKSRTVTASGTDASGKKIEITSVYDKQ